MKGSKKHALPVVSQESTHFHAVSDEVVACSMCAQVQNELTNSICVTKAKLKGVFKPKIWYARHSRWYHRSFKCPM